MAVPEGYEIEVLRPDEVEEMIPITLGIFGKGEPMYDYIGLTPEDMKDILPPLIKLCLETGFGMVARRKDTGKVVGVLYGKTLKEGESLAWSELKPPKTEKGEYYLKVCIDQEDAVDVYKKLDGTFGATTSLLGVHEDHRGKGLGLVMAKKLEEMEKSKGCEFAAVVLSNIASQKIYWKMGYKTLYEMDYNVLELNGEKLFDLSLSNGSKSAIVVGKKF